MTGTILLDPKDKIVEVNDAFCQMLGRNREGDRRRALGRCPSQEHVDLL